MNSMLKRTLLLPVMLFLFSVNLIADGGRNQNDVEVLLAGDWEVVNLVLKPGEPFYGSKEDKEFLESLWKESITQFMGKTTFTFLKDKSYLISVIQDSGRFKRYKGKWKLENNGDILVTIEKGKSPDRIKILVIDEENLELFFDNEDGFMLVMMRK